MYKLSNHTRFCSYNEEGFFLDLLKDEFILFSKEETEIIVKAFTKSDNLSGKELELITTLNIAKLIEPTKKNILEKFDQKKSNGSFEIDWSLDAPKQDIQIKYLDFIYYFTSLAYIHSFKKIFGFYSLIKYLKRFNNKHRPKIKSIEPLLDEIKYEVNSLNKAALFFPQRVKCLEWSIALCLGLIRKNFCAKLNIGIQNHPFASHAWVCIDDYIIADNPNLKNDLAIILAEPN